MSPWRNRPVTAALLGAGALALASLSPAQAQTGVRYVRVDNISPGHVLWVRSGPGRIYNRIGFFSYNARHIRSYGCRVLGTRSWCRIAYRGTRGWAPGRYLKPDTLRRA